MFIIQEKIDKTTWLDRYKCGDYKFICEMLESFKIKYSSSEFRLLELIINV